MFGLKRNDINQFGSGLGGEGLLVGEHSYPRQKSPVTKMMRQHVEALCRGQLSQLAAQLVKSFGCHQTAALYLRVPEQFLRG